MISRSLLFSVVIMITLAALPSAAEDGIALNEKEYFSGPGFSFLLFHNNYQVGFQGGLQMILHDERVLEYADRMVQVADGVVGPVRDLEKAGVKYAS